MLAEKGRIKPHARLDVDALLSRSGLEGLGIEHIPSDSQMTVIHDVLRARDGVIAVTGPAGAGKTQTFAVIGKAIESMSGGQEKLLALAPTHKAITALQDRAG
jgi:ABC-type lipopolysaccharide export system ATPase subunit